MVVVIEQQVDHAVGFLLVWRHLLGISVIEGNLSIVDKHNVNLGGVCLWLVVTARKAYGQHEQKQVNSFFHGMVILQ